MKKAIILTVLAALSFVPVAILGVVNGPRPEPVWQEAKAAAPEAPKAEEAPITLPEITIVASRAKAPSSHRKAAPCRDGESRVVGALYHGKGEGNGATGERTVTLRCPRG